MKQGLSGTSTIILKVSSWWIEFQGLQLSFWERTVDKKEPQFYWNLFIGYNIKAKENSYIYSCLNQAAMIILNL